MLERAQLLERLGPLERRRRQRRERQQELAAVDVQADVLEGARRAGRAGVTAHGIGAREKYSANPWRSTTTFVTLGLAAPPGRRCARRSVLIGSAASAANGATASSIIAGSQQRLVALDVDDEVARRATAATSASRSVPLWWSAPRHPHIAAERVHRLSDALVVGGDDDGATVRDSAARR